MTTGTLLTNEKPFFYHKNLFARMDSLIQVANLFEIRGKQMIEFKEISRNHPSIQLQKKNEPIVKYFGERPLQKATKVIENVSQRPNPTQNEI